MCTRPLLRVALLGVAALLCVASAQQQNQPGQQYGGGGEMDATFCTQGCEHYYTCKGMTDQAMFAGCVQECQQANIDPQQTYAFTQLSCPDAVALVEGGAQSGTQPAGGTGGTGGTGGSGGGVVTTSCPGTVNILGSWGHGGDQMYEVTFYANGRLVERVNNLKIGTVEDSGTFSITNCPSIDVVMENGKQRTFVAGARNVTEHGDGTPYGKCPDEGCF